MGEVGMRGLGPLASAFAAAIALALLAGCATTSGRNTPSGKQEITVPNVSANAAKAYITNRMIDAGYNLDRDSQYRLGFCRRGKQLLSGGPVQPRWGYRVVYSIIEQNPGIRVVADFSVVFDVCTAMERPFDVGFEQPYDPQGAAIAQIDSILAGVKTLRP